MVVVGVTCEPVRRSRAGVFNGSGALKAKLSMHIELSSDCGYLSSNQPTGSIFPLMGIGAFNARLAAR